MKQTSRSKPVILASAAIFAFTLALAPRLFDGGTIFKADVAQASENGFKTNEIDRTGDHGFNGSSDASGHDSSGNDSGGGHDSGGDHDGGGGSDGNGHD